MKMNFTLKGEPSSGSVIASSQPAVPGQKETAENRFSRKAVLTGLLLIAGLSICSIPLFSKKRQTNLPAALTAGSAENKATEPATPLATEKPKEIPKDWYKQITVRSSNYGYGVLGGINNLTVYFNNGTDFPMDEITAKVVYVKANGKAWKTKFITLYNVPPHTEKQQTLNKVSRGRSVEVSLQCALSKKYHLKW